MLISGEMMGDKTLVSCRERERERERERASFTSSWDHANVDTNLHGCHIPYC